MKLIKYIIPLLVLVVASACEDMLDTKLVNQYGDEYTWELPAKVEGILVEAYANIPGQVDAYGSDFLDAATDNALTIATASDMAKLGAAAISPSTNVIGNWGTAYNQFSRIHLFLEKGMADDVVFYINSGDGAEADSIYDARIRARLYGEAHFLRAWWGMELLRIYGGVDEQGNALGYPIVLESLDIDDSEAVADMARNTYEECAQQIFADCDTAIKYLPKFYTGDDIVTGLRNVGRGTSDAARAVKSRVAVYAASKAYQPEGQSDADLKSKWERAALYSYQAISEGGYAYKKLTATQMAGAGLDTDGEVRPYYVYRKYHNNKTLETRNRPPFFMGQARTNPTQNLVNAFPDKDGYPIAHANSSYDPQNPYANRDPRLALNVFTTEDAVETGGRTLQIYTDSLGRPGLDAPGYNFRCTQTGYYLRKWQSKKADMLDLVNGSNDHHVNPLFRVAELFHNYAEASFEAAGNSTTAAPGCDQDAYALMRSIRGANMGLFFDPYLDEVKDDVNAFRALYQNERRLEFAFENHRYFDIRRWMLPLDQLSATVTGITIQQQAGGALVYTGTAADGSDAIEVEERPFNDAKFYYNPLPYGELMKSPNLKNNKGW